jgi:hypothetical protein
MIDDIHKHLTKKNGKKIKQKMPAFIIAMNVRDRWLLTETAEYLGINSAIYINKPYLKDLYDIPIQLSAYLGAFFNDSNHEDLRKTILQVTKYTLI